MSGRRKTLRGLGLVGALLLLAGGLALTVEFQALGRDDSSTISEIVWTAWANQPWAFVIVLIPLTFASGMLAGHFLAAPKVIYDAERAGVNLDTLLTQEIARQAGEELRRKILAYEDGPARQGKEA